MSIETKYFSRGSVISEIFFTMWIAMMIRVGNKEVAWCLPNLGHNVNVAGVLHTFTPAYIDIAYNIAHIKIECNIQE